ncbi:hypothetical protein DPMN_194437 [Dreissena polymorpha]|uniref:Uncharacterized protein n=1 Tax=Dreissena polymorpha TaxID=45954 RepID=A0A9D4B6M1_DREPO|nr:hypothetical protein DPMN_194437 [Dreissena polymorpha]
MSVLLGTKLSVVTKMCSRFFVLLAILAVAMAAPGPFVWIPIPENSGWALANAWYAAPILREAPVTFVSVTSAFRRATDTKSSIHRFYRVHFWSSTATQSRLCQAIIHWIGNQPHVDFRPFWSHC